jgi:high-affinity Fe2+/Pb2+ permease
MGMGVIGFVIGVGTLEYLSNNNFGLFALISGLIGSILLIAWLVFVVRDNIRDTRYPILRYQPQQTNAAIKRKTQSIYDQDDKKVNS